MLCNSLRVPLTSQYFCFLYLQDILFVKYLDSLLLSFIVPPKPVHVEILLRQTQCQSRTTGIKVSQVIFTEQDQSPNSDQGQYVFCTSAVQGSLSPIRLNGEIPNFTRSPITGSSCPGKRGFQSCSPLKEGRQDPATDKHLLTKDVISPQNEGHVIKEMVEGKDCTEVNRINDGLEGDKISVEDSSIFPCQSNEATTEDDGIHKEPEGEQNDEADRKERGADKPKDEEITKQRLYNIANEILQTERAYVARLHLLDQVSGFLNKTPVHLHTYLLSAHGRRELYILIKHQVLDKFLCNSHRRCSAHGS